MKLTLEQTLMKYQSNVYKAAFSICRNAADAEDIAQEAFLAYYMDSRDFENEEHIKAWLIKVAVNKARNLTVSFWRKRRADVLDFEEWKIEKQAESPDHSQNMDILEVLMELPQKQRAVIHLYYYEGYTVKEIAKLLNMREGSVRVQLYRGRKLLREKLREEWEYDEP